MENDKIKRYDRSVSHFNLKTVSDVKLQRWETAEKWFYNLSFFGLSLIVLLLKINAGYTNFGH